MKWVPGFGRGGNVGLDGLVVVDVVRVDDDDGTARRVIVVRFPDWTTSNGKNQFFEISQSAKLRCLQLKMSESSNNSVP